MGGVKAWRTKGGKSPALKDYFLRASQTIDELDFLVEFNDTTTNRVAKATATEVDFQNGAGIAGILGVAWHSAATDANGVFTNPVASYLDPGAVVTYAKPSYGSFIDRPNQSLTGTTPDIGNGRINLAYLDDMEFLIDVAGSANANTTVTRDFIGTSIGLQVTGGTFKLDSSVTSGNAAGFVVVDVDESQPNYNASGNSGNAIWVRAKATHRQLETGLLY